MPEHDTVGRPPASWPLDPFGVWDAWARTLEIREPLSGAVTQAIRAALVEHLGQVGLVNLSIGRTGDPELERRIVGEVASYGRQLGWVLEALEALVRAQRGEAAHDGDERALDRVAKVGAEVEEVKRRTAAERVDRVVADIRTLRADPEANAAALAALRAALDGH